MFAPEKIEILKREWTDKYVVVDGSRPELRRFDGYTGLVKTVNMSGRALVQFDAWNNIGWYDIDCGYLTEVPKPDPAMAGKKAEKQAAAPAEKAPAAEAKPAAKAAGGRMSVAEMLAAARANKPAAAAGAAPAAAKAAPAKAPAKPQAAEKPAAKPAGGTTLPKGKRPSVAEMIAYCREHDAKG